MGGMGNIMNMMKDIGKMEGLGDMMKGLGGGNLGNIGSMLGNLGGSALGGLGGGNAPAKGSR